MRLKNLSLVVLGLAALPLAATTPPELNPESLWQAARDGNVDLVRHLLENGVSVDAKTEFDCTALYFAVNSDHAEVAKVLIEAGADVDVRDNSYGFTAMGMAAWLGHTASVATLLDGGSNPGDAIGGYFAAASNGHADTVQLFIDRELIPKGQLDAGLAMALRSGDETLAKVLKTAGATPPEAGSGGAGGQDSPSHEVEAAPPAPAVDLALQKPIQVLKAAAWPEFRGAGRSGIADGQHPPLAWSLESGRNVSWSVPIEGLGYSSPVVWGNRVFVTTAISPSAEQTIDDGGLGWIAAVQEEAEHRWEVRAYDLESGDLIWKRVAAEGVPRSQRHWKASQANPTCATDGKVLIASFGSEGIHAFDLDGKPLWQKDLGELNPGWYIDPAFEWGYASSPILHDGRVIVQSDLPAGSFVLALDAKSGREVWRTERDEIPSWGTPLVYEGEKGDELILNASNAIVSYDPASGKERWRIRGNSKITVASPVGRDGAIVATGGYRTPRPIYVVKPGAQGDVTPPDGKGNDAVYWSQQTDGVYLPTPLIYRGLLYMCRNNGVLTVYDLKTGEELYKKRIPGPFTASPVAADGRIYFTNENGDVMAIKAGREFEILAKSELGASTLATPAISNGMLVFRTVKELIGIGFS